MKLSQGGSRSVCGWASSLSFVVWLAVFWLLPAARERLCLLLADFGFSQTHRGERVLERRGQGALSKNARRVGDTKIRNDGLLGKVPDADE